VAWTTCRRADHTPRYNVFAQGLALALRFIGRYCHWPSCPIECGGLLGRLDDKHRLKIVDDVSRIRPSYHQAHMRWPNHRRCGAH
jgi:hypothetical protein